MSRTVLSVPDISCEHCEKTITGALTAQPGVRSVKVDIPQKQVTLDYDEGAISVDKISRSASCSTTRATRSRPRRRRNVGCASASSSR